MSTKIHPTAIISHGAELDAGVEVGPFAFIGPDVKVGAGTVIAHHASVEGHTVLGRDNQVFPYAFIGAKTHDLKYTGGNPGLKVGDRNTFREYVSIHAATNDGEFTFIGNDNNILAYSHVAHDCIVGNSLVMSSHAALGGHVVVGNHVTVGWGVGVHQFCRLGEFSMLSACSKVVQDVLPFMLVDGSPAEHRAVNKVGLERHGFTSSDIENVRFYFKTLFKDGLNKTQAMEKLQSVAGANGADPCLPVILAFASGSSQRGIA
jgi:UDP-N-acetylglucosamine acyltransferase